MSKLRGNHVTANAKKAEKFEVIERSSYDDFRVDNESAIIEEIVGVQFCTS